jgi:hypothetical protein
MWARWLQRVLVVASGGAFGALACTADCSLATASGGLIGGALAAMVGQSAC